MSDATKAVFLSYAREDTDAARRIADALRSHGVEVWFDQSELRGGDAWDAKIRQQINDCTLFLPVISKNTQDRGKGYFRLEWKLAVEQTHLMAEGMAFLAPVVIDDTPEGGALVPPEFLRVQWTRLHGALPTSQFVEQVKRLLEHPGKATPVAKSATVSSAAAATPRNGRGPRWSIGAIVAIVVGVTTALWVSRKPEPPPGPPKVAVEDKPAAPAAPKADAKSIAVLPFANLSTDKENEFFADGVHDDVITNLAKIRDLKVISRTSVLAYRDPAARNLKKIAAELGVATVLEGSIRRVGSKVHMNAQLIDARTDEHLWADTFDGDTSDIFALQASLAQKIATALKATLSPNERSLIERRPTENQEAYELYSRARILFEGIGPADGRERYEPVLALLEQAVAKDPSFALAFAYLSGVHGQMYWFGTVDATAERKQLALAALETARRLAPNAPETHLAQGTYLYTCENNWRAALAEYALAEPNLPNDAQLQYRIGVAHRRLVEWPEALACFERSAALNPHDLSSVSTWVDSNVSLRRFDQARTLAARYLTIFPNDWRLRAIFYKAQFAFDGDRAALARAWLAPKPGLDERTQLQIKYDGEMLLGDIAAADRVLAESHLTSLSSIGGTIVQPIAFQRALLAFLRGQREAAAKFAAEAIDFYRGRTLTARQQPAADLIIAQAEAFAGNADAVRHGRAALERLREIDLYSAAGAEGALARIYVTLGRDEDALATLRTVMNTSTGTSANDIRIDPLWARLKDDPRFEEILKSAKPL